MAKILMIEDNKDILAANETMLELEGYEVITAMTVEAGRKLALKENPDLIILDIMLPDGNGIELCRELNKVKDFCIIFLSALGTKNDVLEGLRAGGYDYIAKPYLMEELLLRIKILLKNNRSVINDDFSYGSLTFRIHASIAEHKGCDMMLNPKEYAVLELLCRNADTYLTAENILNSVWNVEKGSIPSVYNCLSHLREKLEETDVIIDFKRGSGYKASMRK